MDLHFPNARLMVYNQLLDNRDDCAGAIVKAAHKLGLLPDEKLVNELQTNLLNNNLNASSINISPNSQEPILRDDQPCPKASTPCPSFKAAEVVLLHCLKSRYPALSSNITNVIKEDMTKDFNRYKENKLINASNKDICADMTPVVMDILLQHLQRYL